MRGGCIAGLVPAETAVGAAYYLETVALALAQLAAGVELDNTAAVGQTAAVDEIADIAYYAPDFAATRMAAVEILAAADNSAAHIDALAEPPDTAAAGVARPSGTAVPFDFETILPAATDAFDAHEAPFAGETAARSRNNPFGSVSLAGCCLDYCNSYCCYCCNYDIDHCG